MRKKNENNKSKIFGLAILSFLLTSGAIITPIMLRYFGKNNTNINKSQLELWTNSNIISTNNLDSLLATDSTSLKENLVNEGIVSSEFANEIKSVKFAYSKNNYQLNSEKVKLDLVVETNDGSTNETVYGISTSVNIVNFDTNKFTNELQQFEISDLNRLLGSANIRNTIYNMDVGFVQDSLQNVTVSESARNNAIIKNSFSPFASTIDCVYKLDFIFNTTNDYVFNTNTSTFGDPNFTNTTNLNNCITKPVNPVQFNDAKLKSELGSISDYNSINNLLTNQNSLINLVNKSNIVPNNDWISSSNITVSENPQHKLEASVDVTLINGQTHTATIATNINVVTFNRDLFMKKMFSETDYNDLVFAHFVDTLKSMNVISNTNAINPNSTTATQLATYRDYNNNKYYIYDVDIALNSNSVFLNGNSVSNSISLKNVDTSIPEQVNINKNILELEVAKVTGSKDAYDSFITKSKEEWKAFLISSNALNITDQTNIIESVTITPVIPSDSDEFVKLQFTVDFVDTVGADNPATLIVNTGLRIVRILEDNILAYFKESVNNDSQVSKDQLETSLIASNANLTSENLNEQSTTATPSTQNYAENDLNHLPCKVFDLNITLNNGYVYLDKTNKIQTQKSISNVLTSIVSDINVDITNLTQAIGSINSVSDLNSKLSDKLNFIKQNMAIANPNWIRNVVLTTENNSGTIAIQGSIQLTNGQTISIPKTDTQLRVVNFDEQTFNAYIKTNVKNANQLNTASIINTITSSSSGLDNNNLNSATANAHTSPTRDPERNNNTYYQYDFTFDLKDGYCFYDNVTGSITNTKTLNNVFTGIITNATVSNVDTVINQIIQDTSSVNDLQTLLADKSKIEEIVKNANIVSDNTLIDRVELTDVTSNTDTNVTLQLIVTLTTGQEAINKEIPTNIKIVNIDQTSLKQFFQQSVTTESMIDSSNLINTLYSSNRSGSGIINNCLADTTTIAATSTGYQNDGNIPFNDYDLTLNLKNDYCFYNFTNRQLTSSQKITQVVSGIMFDINPTSSTLEAKLNSISSYSDLLNYSKNTNNSLLDLVKTTSGYVDDNSWVDSVGNISLTSVSDKVNISFDVIFSTGQVVHVSEATNVTIVTFNDTTFANAVGSVSTATDLDDNSSTLRNLVESALSPTTPSVVSNATSQQLADYYNDSSTGINYYKYNFDFTLADQYCFFDSGSRTISNQMNLNSGYRTNIYVPVSIDAKFNKFIDELKIMTLEDGTNCFTKIFNGTNYAEPNTWTLNKDFVKTITGLDVDSVFRNISISHASSSSSDGMVTLTINADLNIPYQYEGSSTINKQVLTKTYDPNGEYNKSLFVYSGGQIRGVNPYTSNQHETLYFPNWCTEIRGPGGSPFSGTIVSTTLDFRFSQIVSITSFGTFANNSSIVNVTFNGNKYFKNNSGKTNNFSTMRNLAFVDLSNSAITSIPEGMFKLNSNLSRFLLSGCTSLSSIGKIAFQNCTALTELDFSSCTLASVDPTAFTGCTGLTKIYVKDEQSKNLISTALNSVGLTSVQVTIKI
ncbi:MAG: leucine-rich repeat domain-containing protein [Candidatus Ureaplasma intestinipullorum]|uniref:Leucine-rich repeat domain-containing protein n=1 Tax=Candidatus Ureaplasma intestinipullorum TaxID=2838770 RepID=A0A9E2KVE2_9BACT|nr:leucine-rich repeat domain-containing protein [Candidatus Ureaplasma intestinipullorum]